MKIRILSLFIALFLLAAVLCACGQRCEPLDASQVYKVTATDAIYSSYMYVIDDSVAIARLVDIYNGLTFERYENISDTYDLLMQKLYSINYYDTEGTCIAYCHISPDGYVFLDDLENPYRLTSQFDEFDLKLLLEEYDINK